MLSPVSHLYPSEFPVSWTRFNSALKTVCGWLPTSSQQTWELLYHLFNEFSFSCSLALLYCTCFDYNFFLMSRVLCLWIVSLKPGGSQINSKCFLGFSSLGKALVIWVADKNEIILINVFRQIETKLTCLTLLSYPLVFASFHVDFAKGSEVHVWRTLYKWQFIWQVISMWIKFLITSYKKWRAEFWSKKL